MVVCAAVSISMMLYREWIVWYLPNTWDGIISVMQVNHGKDVIGKDAS